MTTKKSDYDVHIWRNRIGNAGEYSIDNLVVGIGIEMPGQKFVTLWIEPVENIGTYDHLFARIYETYRQARYSQQVLHGHLTENKFAIKHAPLGIGPTLSIVQHAFAKVIKDTKFSNLLDARVVFSEPVAVFGPIRSIVNGEKRPRPVLEFQDNSLGTSEKSQAI